MELEGQTRRLTTRPGAWVGAIVIGLAVLMLGWQTISVTRVSHPTVLGSTPAATATPLLDRNAERQPVPSPRSGGPGGQIGDAPSTR